MILFWTSISLSTRALWLCFSKSPGLLVCHGGVGGQLKTVEVNTDSISLIKGLGWEVFCGLKGGECECLWSDYKASACLGCPVAWHAKIN